MTPSKKRQTRTQTHQREDDPSSPDRVDEFATMYPAFCTAPIPVEVLDDLIDQAKEGLCDIVEGGSPGDSLCILDATDLDSIVHGSRIPMQPFKSPFLGMTDDQVRSWMNEHPHPNFARLTFAVLDEDTVKNKTCRIGYTQTEDEDGDKMVTTDFYACMTIRLAVEMVTISWCEQVCFEEERKAVLSESQAEREA